MHVCLEAASLDSWIESVQRFALPITSGPSELAYPSSRMRLLHCQDPNGESHELYEPEHKV